MKDKGNEKEGKRELRDADPHFEKILKQPLKFTLEMLCFLVSILPLMIAAGIQRLFRKKKSVKGKVCLVTGAGRGLGRGVALEMAKLGARVVCVDVHEKNNEETVKMIQKCGGEAEGHRVNVARVEEVRDLARSLGQVDILVNNAALVMGYSLDDWNPEEIVASFNVNILANYWTLMTFLPGMRERNSGQVVSLASASALIGSPFLTVYGPTKAALGNLMESVRAELEFMNDENKIKFTTIYPYFINTSADYMDFYKIRIPPLHEHEAVAAIMDAILYEETEVAIPCHHFYGLVLTRLLPRSITHRLINIINVKANPPKSSLRQSLPYYDIVQTSQVPT